MTTEDFKRKLAAILSADVAGYSRLMGENEEATVRTLNRHKEIISGLIKQNNGRLVDSPGDNVLAEFASVVDAVKCAIQVQKDLKEQNDELPANRKMEFRIGINIGDVIQDGGRIYGDGVNVAARIESLTDPGGICISRTAYDQVKSKIPIDYDYLGEYDVKNINDPVRVYKVLLASVSGKPFQEIKTQISIPSKNTGSLMPEKPSIVVLPFINMSNDPDQEYFSDGMTEELINALAKLDGLKVISRTSAFYFKGERTDLRTIGEKLGVENVLEGSVRKAGNKLRITAQLIKVADDMHLWSEAYNRDLEDVFAIQEEISNAIVDSLKVRLFNQGERPLIKKYTDNMDAYEAYIKGRYFYQSFAEGGLEKALYYYNQAVRLDPAYAPAYNAIAEYYYYLPFSDHKVSKDEAYLKAIEAVTTALKIDENLAEAYTNLGVIKWNYEWDVVGALKAFKKAINLNPGLSKPHHDYAMHLAFFNDSDRAFSEARKAIELDPFLGLSYHSMGVSYYCSGQFDEAIQKFKQAHEMMSTFILSFILLVYAYIKDGRMEDATNELSKGFGIFPDSPLLIALSGYLYAQKGEIEKTEGILRELLVKSGKEYVSPFILASLFADIGEIEKTYEYLEEGYKKRDLYAYIFAFNYLHDPRFNAFFKKIGLRN